MHGTLRFKRRSDRLVWPRADLRLATIVGLAQRWLIDEAGIYCVTITSFYRPGDPGSVHAYYRGADLRTRDMPVGVPDRLCEWLNEMFYYGLESRRRRKRIATYGRDHDPSGAHDDHIHLQVCPSDDYVALK